MYKRELRVTILMAEFSGKTVIMQSNLTFYSIARENGISVEQLKKANNIKDPTKVKAGQKIIIPNKSSIGLGKPSKQPTATDSFEKTTVSEIQKTANTNKKTNCTGKEENHLVEKGDTLSTIAEKHGLRTMEFLALNPSAAKSVQLGAFLTTVAPQQQAEDTANQPLKTPTNEQTRKSNFEGANGFMVKEPDHSSKSEQANTENITSENKAPIQMPIAVESKTQTNNEEETPPTIEQEPPAKVEKEEPGFFKKLSNFFFGEDKEESTTNEITEVRGKLAPLDQCENIIIEQPDEIKEHPSVRIDDPQRLQLSKKEEQLIKQYSQVLPYIKGVETSGNPQLEAYYCESRKLTIGYGSTNTEKFGVHIKKGTKITKELAEQLFNKEIIQKAAALEKVLPEDTPQNIKNALLSLSYNIGIKGLVNSECFKLIKEKKYDEAQGKMDWVNVTVPVPNTKKNKKTGKSDPIYKKYSKKIKDSDLEKEVLDPRTGDIYKKYIVQTNKKNKKKEVLELQIEPDLVLTAGLIKRRVYEMAMVGNGSLSQEGIALIDKLTRKITSTHSIKKKERLIEYINAIKEDPSLVYKEQEYWNKYYAQK